MPPIKPITVEGFKALQPYDFTRVEVRKSILEALKDREHRAATMKLWEACKEPQPKGKTDGENV